LHGARHRGTSLRVIASHASRIIGSITKTGYRCWFFSALCDARAALQARDEAVGGTWASGAGLERTARFWARRPSPAESGAATLHDDMPFSVSLNAGGTAMVSH
jgi:hypothetical protein